MTKIRQIPEHIKSQFPEIVKAAIAQGLSCEPAVRKNAEIALRKIYKIAGLNDMVPIIWVESPLVGAFAASIASKILKSSAVYSEVYSTVYSAVGSEVGSTVYSTVYSAVHSTVYSAVDSVVDSAVGSAVGSAVDSEVYSAVGSAVHSAVYSAVDSAVGSAVDSEVYSAVYSAVDSVVHSKVQLSLQKSKVEWHPRRGGQFWISWPTFIETIMLLGVDDPSFEAMKAESIICKSAGWYWPNKNFIMISERPKLIKFDDSGRLHCENGPAISYGETFEVYSWHGTTIPKEWIEDKFSLSPEIAIHWNNIEQRRAAIEIIGWKNILSKLKSRIIDIDNDPEIGTLLEVKIPDIGKEKLLHVLCGTKREFALPVPPYMKTATEAQAWVWSQNEEDFIKPEVRT